MHIIIIADFIYITYCVYIATIIMRDTYVSSRTLYEFLVCSFVAWETLVNEKKIDC